MVSVLNIVSTVSPRPLVCGGVLLFIRRRYFLSFFGRLRFFLGCRPFLSPLFFSFDGSPFLSDAFLGSRVHFLPLVVGLV